MAFGQDHEAGVVDQLIEFACRQPNHMIGCSIVKIDLIADHNIGIVKDDIGHLALQFPQFLGPKDRLFGTVNDTGRIL